MSIRCWALYTLPDLTSTGERERERERERDGYDNNYYSQFTMIHA